MRAGSVDVFGKPQSPADSYFKLENVCAETINIAGVTVKTATDTAGTAGTTILVGDTINLLKGAGVYALGTGFSPAMSLAGSNIVTVSGVLHSTASAGLFSNDGNNTIIVAATGSIFGGLGGIDINNGGNTVTNNGVITTTATAGIRLGGVNNSIVNHGTVQSSSSLGVGILAVQADITTIVNTGTIGADRSQNTLGVNFRGGILNNSGTIDAAVGIKTTNSVGPDMASTIINSGVIAATAKAIDGGDAKETIVNSGLISGVDAITLEGGNDIYNGAAGRVIGNVLGGGGNDTLLGGAFNDVFDGGIENDILQGGGGADTLEGNFGNDVFMLGSEASGIDTHHRRPRRRHHTFDHHPQPDAMGLHREPDPRRGAQQSTAPATTAPTASSATARQTFWRALAARTPSSAVAATT